MDLHNVHMKMAKEGISTPLKSILKVDKYNERSLDNDSSAMLKDLLGNSSFSHGSTSYQPDPQAMLLEEELHKRIDELLKYKIEREQPNLQPVHRTMPMDALRRLAEQQSMKEELEVVNEYIENHPEIKAHIPSYVREQQRPTQAEKYRTTRHKPGRESDIYRALTHRTKPKTPKSDIYKTIEKLAKESKKTPKKGKLVDLQKPKKKVTFDLRDYINPIGQTPISQLPQANELKIYPPRDNKGKKIPIDLSILEGSGLHPEIHNHIHTNKVKYDYGRIAYEQEPEIQRSIRYVNEGPAKHIIEPVYFTLNPYKIPVNDNIYKSPVKKLYNHMDYEESHRGGDDLLRAFSPHGPDQHRKKPKHFF
jgi:hypothetical protein